MNENQTDWFYDGLKFWYLRYGRKNYVISWLCDRAKNKSKFIKLS